MPTAQNGEAMGDAVKEYFQVLAWFDGDADRPNIQMLDRNKTDVLKSFVKPYNGGEKIFWEGLVRDLTLVKRVAIYKTDKSIFTHVEEDDKAGSDYVDNFNATSTGTFMFGIPSTEPWQSAQHNGADVTKDFIKGPPGVTSFITTAFNNPWVSGIGAGLIVVLIAALFGLG